MKINKKEVEEVLRKSENNPTLKVFLINKLKDAENPILWFNLFNERGYFNPENNPAPVRIEEGNYRIPFWNELSLLERFCTIESFLTDTETLDKVECIIDAIIEYNGESGEKIDNYKTDWTLLKIIFCLPVEKIKQEYVNYIRLMYNSKWNVSLITGEIVNNILPKVIEKKSSQLLLDLLNELLDYKIITFGDSGFSDIVSIMDEYWFNDMISKYQKNFYEICGYNLLNLVENKILELIKYKDTEFSVGQIVTIYDSEQNLSNSYEVNLVRLLRDLLLFFEIKQIEEDITRYLKSENSIFRRIVIYLTDIKYSELNHIIWSFKDNPLNDVEIKHELWNLFSNNNKSFDKTQIKNIITWIETYDYFIPDRKSSDMELINKQIAYKKKEWYYALLTSQSKEVKKQYAYYDSINPITLEHPGYIIWSSGVMITSPYKEVETNIIQLDNNELVQHINSLQDSKEATLGFGPEFSIRQSVQENPTKFTNDMIPFFDLKPRYVYDLFIGLKSAWNQKKHFDWDELFPFINTLIPIIEKWESEKSKYDYRNWTIQQISELIEEGCKDDEHSYPDEFTSISANILIKLDQICDTKIAFSKRLIDYVINSSKGAIYSALIQVSLKNARHEGIKTWLREIKDYFSHIIRNPDTQSLEFFFVIGRYLSNLFYMDTEWIMDNVDTIFSKSDEEIWVASFQGYLSGQPRNRDSFELLNERGDYLRAINYDFKNDIIERSLMNTLATFYLLEAVSPLDNPPIKFMIDKQDPSQLSYLSNFYWRNNEKLTEPQRDLVIDLWTVILESIDDKDQKGELYNSLSSLLNVISELNSKSIKVLLETIQFMDIQASHIILVDNLLRLLEQNPKIIGEAYLLVSEKVDYPYAEEDSIKKLVEELYRLDEKEIANKICRVYTNKGFLFLKDTYEKNI